MHRQAKFAQSTILCFQYLGFHDHTFNRAKLANYVISPGFHGQAFHGQAAEFSCPGFHDKQRNFRVPDSTDKQRNFRVPDSTTSSGIFVSRIPRQAAEFSCPGFHGQAAEFSCPGFHGQAAEFSCPGFHDKQRNFRVPDSTTSSGIFVSRIPRQAANSLPMHCNVST